MRLSGVCADKWSNSVNHFIITVNIAGISKGSLFSHCQVVRRRRSTTSSRVLHPVHVTLSGGKEFGIELEHGVQISRIFPGSPASKQANLSVGDRILSVRNNNDMKTHNLRP